ncbi:hypothetical protein SLT67_21700 [Paenibacillus illinoisensis]|uniref:hypothetical protein n=1 Tax=Paenibacillus illinoisensis TaxID=59845 RepID=UPI003CEC457A
MQSRFQQSDGLATFGYTAIKKESVKDIVVPDPALLFYIFRKNDQNGCLSNTYSKDMEGG